MTIMNFTATDAPISDRVIGQTITLQADVAAVTIADQGTFHIFFVVQNKQADGSWKTVADVQASDRTLTTTPQT